LILILLKISVFLQSSVSRLGFPEELYFALGQQELLLVWQLVEELELGLGLLPSFLLL